MSAASGQAFWAAELAAVSYARGRKIANLIKTWNPDALDDAARAMAPLVPAGSYLIPVPDHNGSTRVNWDLAHLIARHHEANLWICDCLTRSTPVESSCARRRAGLPGLWPREHNIVSRYPHPIPLNPDARVFFVDNVVTTGSTFQACRNAIGRGTGLAYADARRKARP